MIVRTTGFPWEWLERLRSADTAALAERLHSLREQLQALRASGPRLHRPSRGVLAALKAGRPIPEGQIEDPAAFRPWNQLAAEALEVEAALGRALERDDQRVRQALRAFTSDARFVEAIASSSPPVYVDIERGRWNNRLERQLASYLQRFCAKNETMSFFGPINYGALKPEAADAVSVQWPGPLELRGRSTYVASWLVQAVWRKIAFEPDIAPWLVLRRKGFTEAPVRRERRPRVGEVLMRAGQVSRDQVDAALRQQSSKSGGKLGELLVASGACSPADVDRALGAQNAWTASSANATGAAADADPVPRLVREADGVRTLRALAADLQLELEKVIDIARTCTERGLLTHQLEIPAAAPHPLVDLVDRLAGVPGPGARRELGRLSTLLDAMSRYGVADAGEKVQLNQTVAQFVATEWGVHSPAGPVQPSATPEDKQNRRGEGHNFYADRLPLREECGGAMELTVSGARAAELLDRCSRALDLMAIAAVRTRAASLQALAQLVGARRLPFWKVVAAFADRPVAADQSVTQALREAIGDPTAREVELGPRIADPPYVRQSLPIVASVDLLVAARDVEAWGRGEYGLVMGDVHDTALVWGWALQFHSRRAQVEMQMLHALGALTRPVPVVTMLASRRTGLLPSEFPGPVIEVGGVSTRASPWRLPFDDLVVESDGRSARLWSTRLQSEVCLYNGELESLAHTAFALPRIRPLRVSMGAHTPRLLIDGTVIQREQWTLDEGEIQTLLDCRDDRARLLNTHALWKQRGIPPVAFAKFTGERKPILLDAHSLSSLRVFLNLLDQKREVVLSEMYPAPQDLWLKGSLGRHTCELRCTYFREGDVG